jgi:hypothetical protein
MTSAATLTAREAAGEADASVGRSPLGGQTGATGAERLGSSRNLSESHAMLRRCVLP